MEDLEKEVNRLRNQIVDLTEQNKGKLKLIEKESTEKPEIIRKLSKENLNIKKNIDDIKKSHSKAIDLKNSEVKLILGQNDRQKDRIVDLEAKLVKYNSSLKEPINSKDLKHNPVLSCDHCDFKSFKKTDLQIHLKFKH